MNKICLLLVVLASPALAQETPDTVKLKEVVVTATRLPTVRDNVPAAITVIDARDLRRRGVRTVDEALRSVSGAAVVPSGSYGSVTSLFMRGGESDYVQLMMDGVQINSPGEPVNWSNISIENIDRIEIVKGPASVLYGSDAVTGVINLITKQRAGRARGSFALSGGRGDKVGSQADGSFDTAALEAELTGGTPRWLYSGGLSHFDSDGAYAFNNQHRNTSFTARTTLQASASTEVSATARYDWNRFHYPTNGLGQLNDRNQFHKGELFALGLDAGRRLSQRAELRAAYSYNQNVDISDDRADNAADTLGFFRYFSNDRFRRQTADVRVNYRAGSASTLTAGGELEWQSSRGESTSPYGDTPVHTDKRANRAVYAQWLATISRISVQVGARTEDNDRFGNIATYRAGLAAQLSPALRVRANAGTGFKEPRFFEQFGGGFVAGNPNLEPERSRSIEAGADAVLGDATLSATFFAQKFKNLIQYITPANFGDPNYTNVAAARADGLELEAAWTISRFVLKGGYTNLQTRVTDQGDGQDASFANDQPLIRRPEHSGSFGAGVLFDRWSADLSAHFVGARADLDFADYPANRVTLPAYTRIDVSGQYRLTSAATLTLRIENAFDEDYEEVLNFPARGRVVFIGARLSF
jgi:vitamin B12 transporter